MSYTAEEKSGFPAYRDPYFRAGIQIHVCNCKPVLFFLDVTERRVSSVI